MWPTCLHIEWPEPGARRRSSGDILEFSWELPVADRPSGSPDLGKPRLRCVMMYVVGPCQSNENVDVEPMDHGHSPRALCTSSLVIGSVPASTWKTGMPLSSLVPVRLNPRRANTENALPRLTPCLAARARATANTSSSMVTVVRIRTSSHHWIDPSNASATRFGAAIVGHSSLLSA